LGVRTWKRPRFTLGFQLARLLDVYRKAHPYATQGRLTLTILYGNVLKGKVGLERSNFSGNEQPSPESTRFREPFFWLGKKV
jgi:hypothetical protein